MRLAERRTRTFSRKSSFSRASASRVLSRRIWCGAAARSVASKARSRTLSPRGRRAWIYRPRFRSVLVRERRPACLRVRRSSWVSSRRGANSCVLLIFCPPSHQLASCGVLGTDCGPASCWETSAPSVTSSSSPKAFFFPWRPNPRPPALAGPYRSPPFRPELRQDARIAQPQRGHYPGIRDRGCGVARPIPRPG